MVDMEGSNEGRYLPLIADENPVIGDGIEETREQLLYVGRRERATFGRLCFMTLSQFLYCCGPATLFFCIVVFIIYGGTSTVFFNHLFMS